MSRRSRTSGPVFPSLPAGIQTGLRLLIENNVGTVAAMLDCSATTTVAAFCEKCAFVMKQQQLSPASFLARFFQAKVLSTHAILLGKSGKGGAPTLSERIATVWAKNKIPSELLLVKPTAPPTPILTTTTTPIATTAITTPRTITTPSIATTTVTTIATTKARKAMITPPTTITTASRETRAPSPPNTTTSTQTPRLLTSTPLSANDTLNTDTTLNLLNNSTTNANSNTSTNTNTNTNNTANTTSTNTNTKTNITTTTTHNCNIKQRRSQTDLADRQGKKRKVVIDVGGKKLKKLVHKRVFSEFLKCCEECREDEQQPDTWLCCAQQYTNRVEISKHFTRHHGHCIEQHVDMAMTVIGSHGESASFDALSAHSFKAQTSFSASLSTCKSCNFSHDLTISKARQHDDDDDTSMTDDYATTHARTLPTPLPLLSVMSTNALSQSQSSSHHALRTNDNDDDDEHTNNHYDDDDDDDNPVVLLYYCYTHITSPSKMVTWQKNVCENLSLCGKIRVASEGINATVCGSHTNTQQYIASVLGLNDLSTMEPADFKRSQCSTKQGAFSTLSVSLVDEIITLCDRSEKSAVSNTGTHLSPEEFHKIAETATTDENVMLLDCRNFYESRIGTFTNSVCPDLRKFSYWPNYCEANKQMFQNKKVLMFCTGGIRCERGSSVVKSLGVAQSVSQLTGGIHRYLEKYPQGLFRGKLYVFDERQSIATNADVLSHCFYCNTPHDVYRECSTRGCKVLVLSCDVCRSAHKTQCCSDCVDIDNDDGDGGVMVKERCRCVRERVRAPIETL